MVLPFPPREHMRLDGFVAGENLELLARLRALPAATGFQSLWLTGDATSGKSHLLQGLCHDVAGLGGRVAYLPVRRLVDGGGGGECFGGLGGFDLVAVDDLEWLIGDGAIEEALLVLYQELFACGGKLLIAASRPPSALEFRLPDLASRMRGADRLRIRPLDDAQKLEVARRHAARTGLRLPDEVSSFLLQRSRRELGELLSCIDRLEHAALAAQRRLTVPFVKSVLGL